MGKAISIHAPLTGSDALTLIIGSKIYDFNPRSPYGERPRRCCPLAVRWYFNPRSPYGERRGLGKLGWKVSCISIHAPLTGSDCSRHFCWRTLEWISIHAPLTGSDLPAFVGGRNIFYFNPRSPYGERHSTQQRDCHLHRNFNPRSPYGERQ